MENLSANTNRTNQRKSRELALQVLFKLDCLEEENSENVNFLVYKNLLKELLKIGDYPWSRAESLIKGVQGEKKKLDSLVQAKMNDFKRLSNVDKNILRIAIFELSNGLKSNIVINEAIELAKVYSTTESSKLVNRVLDEASKSM